MTTQVKVSVNSNTASAFKEACRISNLSMASVLSQFMDQYSNNSHVKGNYSPDLSTRRQRRAVLCSLIQQLKRIIDNEERYYTRIPNNLQGAEAYDKAEQSISALNEALDILETVY